MPLSLPMLTPLLTPVLALLGLGLAIGAVLGFVAKKFRLESDPVVTRINDLLPQTQCGQCGYPGCKPYAEAIAAGDVINKCPPGGESTISQLADLLNIPALPLDESYGQPGVKKVAFIREAECIGCAKCIPACPVDAILGAPKYMHTVIESECTGCDLCIEPCPVDCIDLMPLEPYTTPIKTVEELNNEEILACINCALCVDECPVDILPHELYWACRGNDLAGAETLKLMHCIECGKCDRVCPSSIPLVEYYQAAMQSLNTQQTEKVQAGNAKQRFELHQQRMETLKIEEEQRRQKRAELAKKGPQSQTKDTILAALERVKSKKKPN